MAGEHAGPVVLTGATAAVTPVRLRPRPYDAPVPEITVFPGSGVSPEPITSARLPAHLASDRDTRTFLMTGPLGAISGPHGQFRP